MDIASSFGWARLTLGEVTAAAVLAFLRGTVKAGISAGQLAAEAGANRQRQAIQGRANGTSRGFRSAWTIRCGSQQHSTFRETSFDPERSPVALDCLCPQQRDEPDADILSLRPH